jgi:hypothetical protein
MWRGPRRQGKNTMSDLRALSSRISEHDAADASARFALLSYDTLNLGDDVQALAALRLMPRVDRLVMRDKISEFRAPRGTRAKIILNGWFMGSKSWPPPETLDPLFVSFHLGQYRYSEYFNRLERSFLFARTQRHFMLAEKSLAFFKAHEPIGCRDFATLEALRAEGIEAYFSACLTLTLKTAPSDRPRKDIIIVEPNLDLPELFRTIPSALRSRVTFLSHQTELRAPPELRMNTAADLLERYAQAHLVITSRLHCALPCLAFGTPVLFIPPGHDLRRFEGIAELLTIPRVEDRRLAETIPWENPVPNSDAHRALADKLEATCRNFLAAERATAESARMPQPA